MIRSTHLALVSALARSARSLRFGAAARGPACAQDQAAVDKLVQMNKKALDDYDTLDWDAAKRTLLEALVAGKKAGLDTHPVMARTYVHLGAVYITGFKDRQKGCRASPARWRSIRRSSFEGDRDRASSRRLRRGAAQRARGGLVGAAGGDDNAPPAPKTKRRGPSWRTATAPPRDDSAQAEETSHDERRRGAGPAGAHQRARLPDAGRGDHRQAAQLRCALAPNLPVASVFLMYRAPGQGGLHEVRHDQDAQGLVQGKIPKKAVTGKSMQFYFEGRNAAGKPVVSNGGADSPNIILISRRRPRARPRRPASGRGTEENPLDEPTRGRQGRASTSATSTRSARGSTRASATASGGSASASAPATATPRATGSRRSTGRPRRCAPHVHWPAESLLQRPGLAWAGLGHLAPEFGYAVQPGLRAVGEGRCSTPGMPSQVSRSSRRAGAIGGPGEAALLHEAVAAPVLLGPLAGGGEGFRFVGYPDAGATTASPTSRTPSRRPVLAGVGGGVYYEISQGGLVRQRDQRAGGLPIFGAVAD